MDEETRALRTLDAQLHAQLFGVAVEWRLCATDPDCGAWEEIESHEGARHEGEDVWGHPAVRHPCFNQLDTDELLAHGWTPEMIAETDRAYRWKVVPHYSTDMSSAMFVIDRLAKLGYLCQMRTPFEAGASDGYWAGFTSHSTASRPDHWAQAGILPLAVARAAWMAMRRAMNDQLTALHRAFLDAWREEQEAERLFYAAMERAGATTLFRDIPELAAWREAQVLFVLRARRYAAALAVGEESHAQ